MSWSFVLTDFNHVPVGEILNAYDRQVVLPLNKLDTASLRVRLDNPLADYLISTACYLKGYRDRTLRFQGPVISAEEVGNTEGASVAINAVGAGWILGKRLAGKSSTGTKFDVVTDRAQIAKALIDTANAENDTGISTGSMSAGSAITYVAGPYRPISEIITDLSATFDGFDWRILPVDNFSSGQVSGSKTGIITAAPVIGQDRPHAVFEWGRNMASYTRTVSRDTQANKVFHFTQAGPDVPGFPTLSAVNTASITNWKLLEDLAQADLVDAGLRQQLVNEHVKIRNQPRQVIVFEPHVDPGVTGRLPNFGTDYDVGDRVRARAMYGRSTRFDGMMRVWGVSFALDNNGLERATLTLSEE